MDSSRSSLSSLERSLHIKTPSLIGSQFSLFLDAKAVKPFLQLVHANEYDFTLEADIVKRNVLIPANPQLKEVNSIQDALAVLFFYKGALNNL